MRWIYFKLLFVLFIVFQCLNYFFLSNYLNNFNKPIKILANDNRSVCEKKFQLYFQKSQKVNYVNYCPLYRGINDFPNTSYSVVLSNEQFAKFHQFNLSREIPDNHIKICSSLCRNLANQYFSIIKEICYCMDHYEQKKTIISNYDLHHVIIYETKAFPITYVKYNSNSNNKSEIVIAFLLMLSGRDVIQVYQLISSIYKSSNYYFIHVDKRFMFLRQYLIKLQNKYTNIFVFSWSMPTIWGGTSLLLAYYKAMQEIISRNLQWDFLINLSESDYPVRSIDNLHQFLQANNNKNFVKSSGQSTIKFIRKQGLMKAFVECDEHLYLVGDRYLPSNLIVDGGSDWFCLSKEFINYIVTSKDDLVNNLLSYFENSLLPAETFFHMVLQNSHFCTTVINANLRYTNWNRERGCRCQHSSVVGWCGCSPSVLTNSSYNMLKYIINQDPSLFFARKFDLSIDKSIISKINNRTSQRNSCSYLHDHSLNFYSGKQKMDPYQALASLLYTKIVSQYQLKLNCFSKALMHNDSIDLFLGISQNDSSIKVKDVILKYQYNNFGFEAVYTYFGKAGSIKKYDSKVNDSSKLNFEIISFMVGQDYDLKENLFRTLPFLMIPGKPLTLELQVTSSIKQKFIFYILFIDPDKNKYSFKLPKLTSFLSNDNQWFDGSSSVTYGWFQRFDIQSPYQVGLWQVILYMNEFRKPTMQTFFYINSPRTQIHSDKKYEQWRLKSFCIYRTTQCNVDTKLYCNNCTLNSLLDFYK